MIVCYSYFLFKRMANDETISQIKLFDGLVARKFKCLYFAKSVSILDIEYSFEYQVLSVVLSHEVQ